MAHIRALPQELLAHTLMFLVDLPAQQKMALSHVCRQLRAAALGSSQFWATIYAQDFRDLRVMDALLDRSRAAALHVRIDLAAVDERAINVATKDGDSEYVHADDLTQEKLRLLVGHISRLQTLVLGFSAVVPFEELLRTGLVFPVLETLDIQYHQPDWNDDTEIIPCYVHWTAPALRTLMLSYVLPDVGWTELLQNSPILENLSFTACISTHGEDVDELLESAFSLCRTLRHFTLIAPSIHDDELTVPEDGWNPSSSLRSVVLHLGPSGEETILEGLASTFLPSITITTYQGIEFPDDEVVPLLMRGIGRIVAIDLEPEQNVTLRDENGNERRLMIEFDHVVSPAYFDNLWAYVCTHHGAAAAVATFAVTTQNWESYSQMPSEGPPPSNVELRLTRALWAKREGWKRQPPPLFGQGRGDRGTNCSDLRCNAKRVSFDADGACMDDVAPLKAALRHIKSPSTIELCLRIRSSQVEREKWLGEGLSVVGDLNSSHDSYWVLCGLCASASH